MTRKMVTQELVADSANAIVDEGGEATVITVRNRLGFGSFSTVKRYLDLWIQGRAEAKTAHCAMPQEVEAKALSIARDVWAIASRLATADAQAVKDLATSSLARMRDEHMLALREIERLEQIESEFTALIEQQQAEMRRCELSLAETRVQANRVAELEQMLAESRRDAASKVEDFARLCGETEALRAQVRELTAALSTNRTPPKEAGMPLPTFIH